MKLSCTIVKLKMIQRHEIILMDSAFGKTPETNSVLTANSRFEKSVIGGQ